MKYILILILNLWLSPAFAIKWPSISEPKIASCDDSLCTSIVTYSHSGTQWIDVMPVIPKPEWLDSVVAWGIHCQYGSKLPGHEQTFSSCRWEYAPEHAPSVSGGYCRLKDDATWELTDDSHCISSTTWGAHSGAGPGGECVLFGYRESQHRLLTPMGYIYAEEAANSGNRFCQKPLPPDTRCDIQLSDTVIDHGVIATNGTFDAVITGVIDCGKKPIVEIVSGGDYKLGPGLDGVLELILNDSGTIRIESHLTAVNAAAGDYSANKVITVSPW